MAVPNITHFAAGGSGGTNVTSQAVTLTQTGAPVGSLILIFITADGNPTITADAASTTAGWNKFDQWSSGVNCTLALFAFEVVIANTIPGLTYTLSASEACYQFQETLTAVTANQRVTLNNVKAQITAGVGTASINPDPPSVANALTTRDIRWMAAFAGDNGTIASTAPPSGYTILAQTSAGNAANGCALGVAHRSAAAFPVSSENPGVFTRAAEDWVAITIGAIETDFKGGTMKVWNGSAWVARPVKVWNGSTWVLKQVKVWNGSAWVLS
jgi:hypothetical protein